MTDMRHALRKVYRIVRVCMHILPSSWQNSIKKFLKRDLATTSMQYRKDFAERAAYLAGLPVPSSDNGPSFSFLTTVYEKTQAVYFHQLAQSVLSQTYRNFEWILLSHGSISSSMAKELEALASLSFVTIYYLPKNLGISGGLRYCLEKAGKEFVIPLDADDLLEKYTLAVLATVLMRDKDAALCYTDEDFLTDDIIHNPYYRPPLDPVLLLSASYVFHLTAIRRDIAIAVEVYKNDATALCHDYDTLMRFYAAKEKIIHISDILYHWRQHTSSISNNGKNNDINHRSLPFIMQYFLHIKNIEKSISIEEFPISRGVIEYYYRFIGDDPFQIHTIEYHIINKKNNLIIFVDIETVRDMQKMVAEIPPESLVVVVDSRLAIDKRYFNSELFVWFTLVPEIAFFTGRVVDAQGNVAVGGLMFSSQEEQVSLISQEAGHPADYGGPYAMYLKPHCVDAVYSGFFAARQALLKEALDTIPGDIPLQDVGAWLGAWAAERDRLVGWSPLFQAVAPSGFSEKLPLQLKDSKTLLRRYASVVRSSRWKSPHHEMRHDAVHGGFCPKSEAIYRSRSSGGG